MIFSIALVAALNQSGAIVDVEAPIIADVAAAASNPKAAPVITVMMSDRGTGVGTSHVYFRATGAAAFAKAELRGGTSGLFIARLPDGLQNSGFDYYVEATDVAGNGPVRIGSPDAPIRVEKAAEPTTTRIAREAELRKDPGPAIHPGWLMLSLGVGVVASAGAGVFALDLNASNKQIAAIDENLAEPGIDSRREAALRASRQGFETAATQDTVTCVVLGVIGGAGIVTGAVLVVISSLE